MSRALSRVTSNQPVRRAEIRRIRGAMPSAEFKKGIARRTTQRLARTGDAMRESKASSVRQPPSAWDGSA